VCVRVCVCVCTCVRVCVHMYECMSVFLSGMSAGDIYLYVSAWITNKYPSLQSTQVFLRELELCYYHHTCP